MNLRNHTVGVYTFRCAPNDGLQIVPEVDWPEVWIEVLGNQISEIFCVFRGIVSPNTPRQLILSQIAGDELDGIEGIGLARLPGGEDPSVDAFLRNL